jgi:hypothetical protein
MPDDSFLWGLFRWNIHGEQLHFVASGELPALMEVTQLKQSVANDDE